MLAVIAQIYVSLTIILEYEAIFDFLNFNDALDHKLYYMCNNKCLEAFAFNARIITVEKIVI